MSGVAGGGSKVDSMMSGVAGLEVCAGVYRVGFSFVNFRVVLPNICHYRYFNRNNISAVIRSVNVPEVNTEKLMTKFLLDKLRELEISPTPFFTR